MLQRFSCISFLFKPPCSNQRNGSEMTFVAAATKINLKNLKKLAMKQSEGIDYIEMEDLNL